MWNSHCWNLPGPRQTGWLSFDCYSLAFQHSLPPFLTPSQSPCIYCLGVSSVYVCFMVDEGRRKKLDKGTLCWHYGRNCTRKLWNLFLCPFCSFHIWTKCMKSERHRCMFLSLSLNPDLTRDLHRREQDDLWSMIDVPLSCFLWFCLGFCLIIFECCSFQSHGDFSDFWKARLLLIMSHGLMFWLFVKFCRLISGLLPLWFGKKSNSNK